MARLSRRMLLSTLPLLAFFRPALAESRHVEIWKNVGCECCTAWAAHLEKRGFTPAIHEVRDVAPIRAMAGVPKDLASCHTASLYGYALEGHVPIEAIERLLAERPAILGIAVPGMPIGSLGMEVPDHDPEPYDVIAFAADGTRSVFMKVRP
jgi:hypothetical protein